MTTLNLQVAASADDGEQGDATSLLTGTYIRWYQGSTCYGGFRFVPGASIPIGSTNISAVFSYKYTHTDYDTLTATVWAQDAAGPLQFTTDDNNISGRTPTTATAAINETDAGTDWRTLDVASILQELATSYTITAIAIIVYDATSDSARWTTWDGNTSNCPKLDIEYTAPAAGVPRHAAYYHRRRTT